MKNIRPARLGNSAHIRVIAPSLSMSLVSSQVALQARQRFERMGFSVSFGRHVFEIDQFSSSSIASRVADIHEAFEDESVDAILCALGGYNANQLLPFLDYDLIAKNPKILCGYSDITILLNAISKKSHIVTYYGPNFLTFAQKELDNYVVTYLQKAFQDDKSFQVIPAQRWSNDIWYADQNNRRFMNNEGYWILQPGIVQGIGVGGHLGTTCLLQGTKYMPSLKEAVLLIEEDADPANPKEFDRRLQSLLQQSDAKDIKGILIGRFELAYNMSRSMLEAIITSKNINSNIPIIANVDFGHTEPHATFPIGGKISIIADVNDCKILID